MKVEFILCWEDGTWTTEHFDVPSHLSSYDGKPDLDDLRLWAMGGGLGEAYRKVAFAFPID